MLREIVRVKEYSKGFVSKAVEIQRWIFVFVAETFDFSRTPAIVTLVEDLDELRTESGSGRLSEF